MKTKDRYEQAQQMGQLQEAIQGVEPRRKPRREYTEKEEQAVEAYQEGDPKA